MVGRQEFIAVAQMVLAELSRGVAERLQRLRNGDVPRLQSHRSPRHTHLGQSGAEGALTGDERRAAGRAAILRVVVGEQHAFFGDAVNVGRFKAHDPHAVGADVRLADVIAKDHKNVRLLPLGKNRHGEEMVEGEKT